MLGEWVRMMKKERYKPIDLQGASYLFYAHYLIFTQVQDLTVRVVMEMERVMMPQWWRFGDNISSGGATIMCMSVRQYCQV
jgi:hypothetical protein